jgi:hypothetical protein
MDMSILSSYSRSLNNYHVAISPSRGCIAIVNTVKIDDINTHTITVYSCTCRSVLLCEEVANPYRILIYCSLLSVYYIKSKFLICFHIFYGTEFVIFNIVSVNPLICFYKQ